jgi:PAS domain S-box-containing protein
MSLNAGPVAQLPISHGNTDISDHKTGDSKTPGCDQRQEQEWRIPEMLLSSMVDHAFALDREGRFLYVNQPLLNLWGLKLKDAVGKTFFDLLHPRELAARLHEQVQKVFATGQRITDVAQYTSPSGVFGFYEYILSPIIDSEGRLELVAGATRNISARKNEERRLMHMEARYRGLLEAAPDAMVVVDKFGKIVLLNAQAEKHFGYYRDVLIGQEVTNIIPEGFAERLIADGTRTAAEALAQQIGTGIELVGKEKPW